MVSAARPTDSCAIPTARNDGEILLDYDGRDARQMRR